MNRTITTYPQQIAAVPGGVSVAAFLNNLFVLRISDTAERQSLIDQFINNRGLPVVVFEAPSICTPNRSSCSNQQVPPPR